MVGYVLKNCVSWFVSIILNFNALSDAYTAQRQSYTMLLKSNRIFCQILGINFENYFLTVSNVAEDPLCLYFVCFLNYPPMFDETHREIFSCRHYDKLNATLSSSCWKVFGIYERCMICLSRFLILLLSYHSIELYFIQIAITLIAQIITFLWKKVLN